MAEFSVAGNMKVKTLQAQYKQAFGGTLRIYKGNAFADPEITLASIRSADAKGGELKISGQMLVGNFETKFKEVFGIKVQVANKDNSALSDNADTITAAGNK